MAANAEFHHLSCDGDDPLCETLVPPRVRLKAGLDNIERNDR